MKLDWSEITTVLANTDTPVLIYGPPALGKSYLAQTPGCYAVTLTPDTPAAELRGHYIPQGDRFIWQDGPMTRAYAREGVRFVANEINLSSGDVQTLFYVVADHPATSRMTLPTSETVTPIAGFSLVATMNGSPDELPAALRSRFAIQIEVDTVNPIALQALSARYRETAIASIGGQSHVSSDLRQWFAFERLAGRVPEELAARAVFREHYQEIMTAVALANVKA